MIAPKINNGFPDTWTRDTREDMARTVRLFLTCGALLCAAPQSEQTRLPQFDVASVKQVQPGPHVGIDIAVMPGGRLVATGASLQDLIAGAYGGLQLYQVVGPDWIGDLRFNIEAMPPENDFGKQPAVTAVGRQVPMQSMLRLRALLIERFHLKTHFEMRSHDTYELILANGGPKLSENKDPAVKCRGGLLRVDQQTESVQAMGCSMPWLASLLGRRILYSDVTDKTGLMALYDFTFKFAQYAFPRPAARPRTRLRCFRRYKAPD